MTTRFARHNAGGIFLLAATTAGLLAAGCDGRIGMYDGQNPMTGAPVEHPPHGGPPLGTPKTTSPPPPGACDAPTLVLGDQQVQRLTSREYRNTVRDLFPDVDLPALELPGVDSEGFDNDRRQLHPSEALVQALHDGAVDVASRVVADDAARARLLGAGCEAPADDGTAQRCGRDLVEQLGRRAFRRPLEPEEVDRWVGLFEAQRQAIDYLGAVELVVGAMLQAPRFVYRLEWGTSPAEPAGEFAPLDPWELASRLSYFLWQSAPDERLAALADSGELLEEAVLEAEARRMLEDPRAESMWVDFHRQWLHTERIEGERIKEEATHPAWQPEAVESSQEEMRRFTAWVFREDGRLETLLTSRTSFVDDALAPLYGLPSPGPGVWEQVELPEGERAGVLTRVNFLAGFAHAEEPSPILRGVFVLDELLCSLPGAAPADAVSSATPFDPREVLTSRDRTEIKTSGSACSGCHSLINPAGFAMEHYDASGAWRDEDHGLPVNATGELYVLGDRGQFDGALEMSAALARDEQVHRCVTRHWLEFAFGRAEERADRCRVQRLTERLSQEDGDMRELLIGLVTDEAFRHRTVVRPEQQGEQ